MLKTHFNYLSQFAFLACFLTVTSKGIEGRTIISLDAIKTIENSSNSCNYGVAVQLKDGKRICILESLDAIEKNLAAQKGCER